MCSRRITSLKTRMIFYLSMVLVVAMLLSTATAFLYFFDVMRRQHLQDEKAKLRQVADQLVFQAEDIMRFANSVAVDETIQSILFNTDYEDEFERVKAGGVMAERLVFYNSLRHYISTSIILTDHDDFYNSRRFHNDVYYIRKFSDPVLTDFLDGPEKTFSRLYVSPDTNTPNPVICYKLTIRNMRSPSQIIGTLYLEINASFFLQDLQRFGHNYENLLWKNADGALLYDGNSRTLSTADASPVASDGYHLVEQAGGTGWELEVVVSKAELAKRSSFVIVFFVLFFASTIALMLATLRPILAHILNPITKLTDTMASVREGNLDVHPQTNTHDEIALLYDGFNAMIDDIRRYLAKQQELERQKRETEFDILLAQVNPHYLYNLLNTVAYLAEEENNERVVNVVNAQIRILQENLRVGENMIFTTVREELIIVDSYLSIQRYRYPDFFEIQTEVADNLLDQSIPKAILQPLVENALFHGLVPKEQRGIIKLRIFKENDFLVMTVWDNGIGMDADKIRRFHAKQPLQDNALERKHIGITNVRDRIAFLYGEPYGVRIESRPGEYTLVRVLLPIEEAPKPEWGKL